MKITVSKWGYVLLSELQRLKDAEIIIERNLYLLENRTVGCLRRIFSL